MKQLVVNLPTGAVTVYPQGYTRGEAPPFFKIVDVTPEMEAILNLNKEVRWLPDDLENPDGPGQLQAVELSLDDVKANQREYVARERYTQEIGGIVWNGAAIGTSRFDQQMLTGASAYTQQNPEVVIQWKGPDGFIELTGEQLTELANAVGAHVQAAFAKEAALNAVIDAAQTVEEVQQAVW